MTNTVSTADEADLDSIAWVIDDPAIDAAWLRWRLHGPAGPGLVVRSEASLVLLARLDLGDDTPGWQQVLAIGDARELEPVIRDAVGARPRVALGSRPAGTGWNRFCILPSWMTGPDPFEPLQAPLAEPDARHTALGGRLACGGRAPVQTWSGRRPPQPEERSITRDAAWLRWRLAEPGDARIEAMQVGSDGRCRGWILLRAPGASPARALHILDLQAEDRVAHYALLKAARQRSWQLGGVPVVLHGERMSRRYAFTAGFVPAGPPVLQQRLAIWTHGPMQKQTWRAWQADA